MNNETKSRKEIKSRIGEFVEVQVVQINEKDMWVNFDPDMRTWGLVPLIPNRHTPNTGTKFWACIIGERIGDINKDPHDVLYTLVTGPEYTTEIITACIPCIRDGRVVIRESVIRGHGSKIAVTSLVYSDPREQLMWDLKLAVQAGLHKALRVNIDFVRYRPDLEEYVKELLSGIQIQEMRADFIGRTMDLSVDRSDVFRVLGKNGINIFLIQELLGMKITVHAQTIHFPEFAEDVPGRLIHELLRAGIKTSQDLAEVVETNNKDQRVKPEVYEQLNSLLDFKVQYEEEEPTVCPICGTEVPTDLKGNFKCPQCGATLEAVWDD